MFTPVLDAPTGRRFATPQTVAAGFADKSGSAVPVSHDQWREWLDLTAYLKRENAVLSSKSEADVVHRLTQLRKSAGAYILPPMAGGARASNVDVLAGSIGSASAITGSATETILFPSYLLTAGGNVGSNSPNYYQGKMIRITWYGVYTSAASTPGTGTIKLHMGTANTNADTVVVASAAITLPVSGSNDAAFGTATLNMNAIGSSGNTVIGAGSHYQANHTTTSFGAMYCMNGSTGQAAPAAVAVNTTVNNFLGVYWTFSSATTNTTQIFQWYYEELDV